MMANRRGGRWKSCREHVMRAVLMSLCLLLTAPACADTIEQVLQSSQLSRLQTMRPIAEDDPRAGVVGASFYKLLAAGHHPPGPAELRVIEGPVLAECLLGRVIVVNVSLADAPEGERLFVLAHELGHLINGHWAHVGSAFKKHIPGEVTQAHTDGVAALIGPEMSALSHRHEFDADAYALRALEQMGFGLDTVLASFMRHGVQHDTATHPGTRKRLAHLRVIERRN
jgi:predicted Zn-dependent protease